MKIPDKVYLKVLSNSEPKEVYRDVIKFKRTLEDDVEYIRTDAFIEKACEWLKNSSYGYLTENWGEIELDRETLAVDFANYMKGE
jgi:hypothetical protein